VTAQLVRLLGSGFCITDSQQANEILVACEGLPALFNFTLGVGATDGVTIPLRGNPLDVTFIQTSQAHCTVVVSVDNVHKPGSTTVVRDANVSLLRVFTSLFVLTRLLQDASPLEQFSRVDGAWREDISMKQALEWFAQQGTKKHVKRATDGDTAEEVSGAGSIDHKALRDILYHVENLRKRPGAED
jgi:tRNA (guanine-N(7)-)-methyltransferase subunit TRM82